jgi:uncharacterized protein YgiB involved in biofilm formation
MKKSEFIKLVLVAAVISSCSNQKSRPEKRVFMRSDTTAHYSHVHGFYGGYLAFRPFGIFTNRGYARTGYFSSAIHESSNIGTNSFKGTVVRGGFGGSVSRASS